MSTTTMKRPEVANRAELNRLRQMVLRTPLTGDALFWLQVDCGREWLHLRDIEGQEREWLRDSLCFWEWFCTMWDITDMQAIQYWQDSGRKVSHDAYYQYKLSMLLEYTPNNHVLKEVHRQVNAQTIGRHAQQQKQAEGTLE
jgi:hypothetical protein